MMNVFCFPTAKKTSDAVRGASGYRRLHLTQLLSSLLIIIIVIIIIIIITIVIIAMMMLMMLMGGGDFRWVVDFRWVSMIFVG